MDYVKRQVKCPECRAEHRVPYNGIQGFPTNYTLQKFLELHAEITGESTVAYMHVWTSLCLPSCTCVKSKMSSRRV